MIMVCTGHWTIALLLIATREPLVEANMFTVDTNSTDHSIVLDATRYVCDSTANCKVKESSQVCEFECLECSCENSCLTYGDCCPEFLEQLVEIKPPTPPYTSCVETNWTTWGQAKRALMVDKCPENANISDDVLVSCESPDHTVMIQATPVLNPDTLISYRNKFCAACHGVRDFELWTHKVTCEDGRDLREVETEEELWEAVLSIKFCSIVTSPPLGMEPFRCYPKTIDKCNVSGLWPEAPDNFRMDSLCSSYKHPVRRSGRVYRNIFCAVCNGENVFKENTDELCTQGTVPDSPFPLSVLLDFQPKPQQAEQKSEHLPCQPNEILDPFQDDCVRLRCHNYQILVDGECQMKYSSTTGIGFSLNVLLHADDDIVQAPTLDLARKYLDSTTEILANYYPYVITNLTLQARKSQDAIFTLYKFVIAVSAPWHEMQKSLHDLTYLSWQYGSDRGLINFTSTPVECPPSPELLSSKSDLVTLHRRSAVSFRPKCKRRPHECVRDANYVSGFSLPMCPFVEYNMSKVSFTYHANISLITFGKDTFEVNASLVFVCGDVLKVCSDAVKQINHALRRTHAEAPTQVSDLIMSTVSTVTLSLSLLGLLLTFIIYLLLPKLRTVPGKITILLVTYIFLAQFIFLLGSNWTDDEVICKSLAISIHYLWVGSFSWMSISAYHMMTVFTSLTIGNREAVSQRGQILKYFGICNLAAVVVVGGCLAFYLIRSNGQDLGYGDRVCFLKESLGIGIFFACPLGVMLVFNSVCFVRTIVAIQTVPDMTEASGSTQTGYIAVYAKLSVLLGFSWAFGIAGTVFDSNILRYIFIVLTGAQGVFVFTGYCLNKRIWVMLKARLVPG